MPTTNRLPEAFSWLADAPLFIDEVQIDRFYDAVVRPINKEGVRTLEVTEETAREISGKLGLEAGISPSEIVSVLLSAFIKPEIKGSGEAAYTHGRTNEASTAVELHPISTPQRQLEQLTLHYLVNNNDRLFFPKKASEENWRDPVIISKVPRELVFLDLPGQQEAEASNLPTTKIIPTAAEFANGRVITLFDKLTGNDNQAPPPYPEKAISFSLLQEQRKEYWRWFDENFSATKAMGVIEKAAAEHGRIHWIDYRIPITNNGDTLHVDVSPSGKYDTGVFAYNFVKRGFKHGLRLVGTLKSEPDMNVLAIYDK